jgi:peptidoglycan hydrolase-like protein with peptidoglycan-binding domain
MTLFKQSALAAAVCLALAPAAFAQQTSGSSSTPAADTGATSSTGSTATPSSDEVRQVQQHLKDKGVDVGAVDGVMGPKTRAALKSFQQQQGLTASGDIDASTLTALGVQGGGSTMDSSPPAGGAAAPGATGGSPPSTSPSGGTGSSSSSPSDSGTGGTSGSTMPKK